MTIQSSAMVVQAASSLTTFTTPCRRHEIRRTISSSSLSSSRRCLCGKILPWSWSSDRALTTGKSNLDETVASSTSHVSILPSPSSPSFSKAVSAFDQLYQQRIEKDKLQRLAAFDLIQSLQDDCTLRRHGRVAEAQESESPLSGGRSRQGTRSVLAREMLQRGDCCFDCARKHSAGSTRKQPVQESKKDSTDSFIVEKASDVDATPGANNLVAGWSPPPPPTRDASAWKRREVPCMESLLSQDDSDDCDTCVQAHGVSPQLCKPEGDGLESPATLPLPSREQEMGSSPRLVISECDADLNKISSAPSMSYLDAGGVLLCPSASSENKDDDEEFCVTPRRMPIRISEGVPFDLTSTPHSSQDNQFLDSSSHQMSPSSPRDIIEGASLFVQEEARQLTFADHKVRGLHRQHDHLFVQEEARQQTFTDHKVRGLHRQHDDDSEQVVDEIFETVLVEDLIHELVLIVPSAREETSARVNHIRGHVNVVNGHVKDDVLFDDSHHTAGCTMFGTLW